ncbi:MAG: TIGR00730 family Rossman fold protein [Pseudomonadales bacterium]
MKRICVNCGSSEGKNPAYRRAANSLGTELAKRDIGLVYGGARVGLMGAVADAVLAAGGEVIGIITRDLGDIVGHESLTSLEIVDTMHDRKRRFADLSDGYIALPGGFGTLEEIFEAITWNQLHIQERPTGLLNTAGYFNELFAFLDHAAQEGMIREEHRKSVLVASQPDQLINQMATYRFPHVAK